MAAAKPAGLPVDPFAAIFGGMGAGLGQGLGAAIGGAPAGPAISGGAPVDARSFMDGSGWTVSTGSSKATGGKSGGGTQGGTTGGMSAPGNPASGVLSPLFPTGIDGASMAGLSPVLLLGLGVMAWAMLRKG